MKVHPAIVTLGLLWFATGFSGSLQAAVCDVDYDDDVDRLDLRMIASARDTPSAGPGDSRDADADGSITMLDVRACIRQCSLTGCEIIGAAASASTNRVREKDAINSEPEIHARPRDATQGGTITSVGQWQVRPGDTLYSISRVMFPRDTDMQARFRQEVMELNPSIFAGGANNMAVGAVLELPDYVGSESAAGRANQAATVAPTFADAVTSGIAPRPPDAGPVMETAPAKAPDLASASSIKTMPEPERKISDDDASEIRAAATSNEAQAGASISLGYSQGGDRLDDTGDASDLDAGSGVHLRLGFEQMFRQGGGYRVALGLQYNLNQDNGDSTTFRDAYLLAAYQQRSEPIVSGIGLVVHTGATLKEESTRQYDPAVGAVVYLENVGNGTLSGWGFSYTHLEIEEQNVGESIDASRAELYYSWRF